jgi:hypothetical protein
MSMTLQYDTSCVSSILLSVYQKRTDTGRTGGRVYIWLLWGHILERESSISLILVLPLDLTSRNSW